MGFKCVQETVLNQYIDALTKLNLHLGNKAGQVIEVLVREDFETSFASF